MARARDPATPATGGHGPWKTAIVFWGVGAEAPGWLVRCLSEFASRGVNLTRIESRPRKQGLGRYMFFCDLEGRAARGPCRRGAGGAARHVEHLRVLGSFPGGRERADAAPGTAAQSGRTGHNGPLHFAHGHGCHCVSTTSATVVRAASGAPAARA